MKKILIALFLLALYGCEECPAMDRFEALSQIETGDNDFAVGKAGEISRYQVTVHNWTNAAPLIPIRFATNPMFAKAVAASIADRRERNFEFHHHRAPTDFEFYKLWNPRCPDEIAQRFANLCSIK